jgi:arabinan endo-1,5-alpha-L-arabinosidase
MNKLLFYLNLAAMLCVITAADAQNELTNTEAQSLYKSTTKTYQSVHDPSVVYDPTNRRYYVFGSHKAGAFTTDFQKWTVANPTWKTDKSTNASNKTAFVTPAVKMVKKGGEDVAFPQFNAYDWSARSDAGYNIDGNMWAPDVIWNPTMNKWCMYLSINGDAWYSSIILLTADKITGPYLYQGPVVICGFRDATHSYKETDLELVIGQQNSLPSRYARTSSQNGQTWGDRWPHTIDPAVFYDEEGKLWLVYGSWSGGIWMLELNEENGLRDYDVTYPSTGGNANTVSSDPYFGKKVAGGLYVSGEGPYIEHIGNYYYLFVSYGGFAPDGGYEMRVFRSDKPDGPYKDASGRSAIFTEWVQNYGLGKDNRGEKIMGAYNKWGFQTKGECAQGHNSIIAADDGRTYLVYHTKFNDGTIGHQLRTHQVLQNKNGWLVAAPFEYNGETIDDQQIASTQPFTADEIVGQYHLIIHKYKMDYANMEEVTPVDISLNADGTISGSQTGTWSIEEGTGYISLKLGSTPYNGVVFEEVMDQQSLHTVSITAMSNVGVNIWAYKLMPQYELAYQAKNLKLPRTTINQDIYLYDLDMNIGNTQMTWTSSQPDIISNYGKYNPTGLANNTQVTLNVRLDAGNWYWTKDFYVTAYSEENAMPYGDYTTGMVAHYGFDDADLANTFDATQHATLKRNSTTALPTIEGGDPMRTENVAHLYFGAANKESYVSMPNPLNGQTLEQGATIAFWVKRTDDNLWDALFGLENNGARLFMTGNAYIGFNDNAGKWLDINKPDAKVTNYLEVGKWHHVVLSVNRDNSSGIQVYVDGTVKNSGNVYNGAIDGTSVSTKNGFDYNYIVDHLTLCKEFWLGKGSFWGSPDACFDDVIIYNKPLTSTEVSALFRMESRVFDFRSLIDTGIHAVQNNSDERTANAVYDLQGRRVEHPKRGFYIINNKKVFLNY